MIFLVPWKFSDFIFPQNKFCKFYLSPNLVIKKATLNKFLFIWHSCRIELQHYEVKVFNASFHLTLPFFPSAGQPLALQHHLPTKNQNQKNTSEPEKISRIAVSLKCQKRLFDFIVHKLSFPTHVTGVGMVFFVDGNFCFFGVSGGVVFFMI